MANPNDATFHAKITADARDFIQQTEAASQALANLVSQSSKISTGSQASNTKSGENEAKKLGAAMRAEQEKTSRAVQEDIKQENRLRAEGVRAAGARPSVGNDALQIKEPLRLIGPVRSGLQGAEDTKKLVQGYARLSGAVRKYGSESAIASERANKGLDTTLTKTKQLYRLEGPVRSAGDEAKLIAGMADLNRARDMEKIQIQAILEDRKRMAAVDAAAARANRQQMDAMVTGRYALYDLSEAYTQVSTAGLRFLGLFKQAIITGAEFETAFTSVEGAVRPLPHEVDALRESLVDLTREIPLSFAQISEIATLGAQMGVAAKDIEGFTKTVASFSAVTGASIDETAEAFGRISSLADVPVNEFENLASAITFAGVNAVATEEQILTLTQSIAASSRQAGFTADEIVGLATALASLGVQPEQARGVLLRVFGQIGQEIDKAGEKLEVFSNISGMSVDAIKASWGEDPKVFFGAFLEGLNEAENKTEAFNAAGFVDTREINVLQRLSQNMEVYNSSMQDAINAYGDGTYLGERYSLTVDNLASKIIILQNNLAAFGASIGDALEGPLKVIIDALSIALVSITKFAQTPLGGFVVAFAGVTAALITGFTLIKSLGFRATAQLFAMRTAMIQMSRAGVDMNKTTNVFKDMISTMMGYTRMVEVTTVVNGRNVVSTQFMTRSQAAAAGQLKAWTAAAGTATIAGKGLAVAMRALGLVSGVLAIASIVSIGAELAGITGEAKKIEGLDFESISGAIKADTEALQNGEKAYSTFIPEVKESTDEVDKNAKSHERLTVASIASSDAIKNGTIALGKNTKAAFTNAIANDQAIKKTLEQYSSAGRDITEILETGGGSWEELIEASLAAPGDGAANYIRQLMPQLEDEILISQNKIFGGITDMAYEFAGMLPFMGGVALDAKANKELADLVVQLDESSGALKEGADYASLWGDSVTDAAGDSQDGLEDVRSIADRVADTFNEINSEIKLEEAIDGLGQSLADNGKEFNTYSDNGRTNIESLQNTISAYAVNAGGDADLLATNLTTLMLSLTQMGINSTLALQMVSDAIEASGGVASAVSANAVSQLAGRLNNVQSNVRRTVRTVIDYANDLRGVFDRAFEIRYGRREALDEIAEGWRSIAEAAEDAEESIASAQGKTDDLQDERQILEYRLEVAIRYGDEEKAARIRRQIADIDREIAKNQDEIASAQGTVNRTTEGNSEAAIENRSALRGQLGSYQSLVEMYAKTGLKGNALKKKIKELKEEFRQQGLQAGYSDAQLAPYLQTFNDMTTAVDEVPRNVTVEFNSNISAADQALREYNAKLEQANRTVTTKFKTEFKGDKVAIQRAETLLSTLRQERAMISRAGMNLANIDTQISMAKIALMLVRGYAQGGFVNGAGTSTSDSIPAMLSKGEYVVKASAVSAYGVDFMNAINQQRVSKLPPSSAGSNSASSNSTMVYLSPQDRMLLSKAIDRPISLYTTDRKIAESANAGNKELARRGNR